MPDTHFHINTAVFVGGPETTPAAISDILRGASPDVVKDIDPSVPEATEPRVPIVHDEAEEHVRLDAVAAEIQQDRANALTRKTYLVRLIREVGRNRGLEGFMINHQEEPKDRTVVEERHIETDTHSRQTLARACGVCALANNCAIRGNLSAWVAAHPYAKSDRKLPYTGRRYPQVRQSEARMKFLDRLDENPLAHCLPQEDPKVSRIKKAA